MRAIYTHADARGAFGRRITPSDPARSLILLKPTNAVPHKGGERFKVGSPEWTMLCVELDRRAACAGPAVADDPRAQRLIIEAAARATRAGREASTFTVRAHFTDGHEEDVTRLVKWTAVNQSPVINVDDNGEVTVIGNGESALSAWCLQQIAVATVASPFPNQVPQAEVFTQAPRRNWIDELVLAKLQSLALPPSPRCTDGQFIRRAFIDTIGRAADRGGIARLPRGRHAGQARPADRWACSRRPEGSSITFRAYKWS